MDVIVDSKTELSLIEKKINAFDRAHDIRKFEIEMYWKRATYFWAFIASSFVALFAILASDKIMDKQIYLFFISSIGIIFSLGWYLVNRGSKYWQLNWEKIIYQLEDEISGPLLKTRWISENSFWELTLSKKYSVTKINQIISLYVFIIWGLIGIFTLVEIVKEYKFDCCGNWLFPINLILLLSFIFVIIYFGRSMPDVEKGSITKIFG